MREKLWSECSKEEKAEVRQLEKDIKALKESFRNGLISHRKYSYRKTKLKKKIDEVEAKYAD